MASEAQRQWEVIARETRLHLMAQVNCLPARSVPEVNCLMQAIQTAMANEVCALTFDELAEGRRQQLERQAAYGD